MMLAVVLVVGVLAELASQKVFISSFSTSSVYDLLHPSMRSMQAEDIGLLVLEQASEKLRFAITMTKGIHLSLDHRMEPHFEGQQHAPWHLARLNLEHKLNPMLEMHYFYERHAGRKGYIFLLDSGIDVNSPAFANRARIDYPARAPAARRDPVGHGTAIAGVAISERLGVAKAAEIAPRVTWADERGPSVELLLRCMRSVSYTLRARPWRSGRLAERTPIVVIAASTLYSWAIHRHIVDLNLHGALVVAAASDTSAQPCALSPASDAEIVTVGGTTRDDTFFGLAGGSCIDLLAPAKDLQVPAPVFEAPRDADADGTFVRSGNSLAAGIVAGLAAVYADHVPPQISVLNRRVLLTNLLRTRATPNTIGGVPDATPNLLAWYLPYDVWRRVYPNRQTYPGHVRPRASHAAEPSR